MVLKVLLECFLSPLALHCILLTLFFFSAPSRNSDTTVLSELKAHVRSLAESQSPALVEAALLASNGLFSSEESANVGILCTSMGCTQLNIHSCSIFFWKL